MSARSPRKFSARVVLLAAVAAVVLVTASTAGIAGEMSIAWDPVSDSDLAGYKVYYGTSPGSYTETKDVGNTTSTTLTGLDPCTVYYVAVKAYDTEGLESEGYSNEISGLPRPVVASVTPNAGDQGQALTLTIDGESFDDGASVEFSGSGITVQQVTTVSCTELSVDIQIAEGAAPGARDVTVINPDNSFGTKADAFNVEDAPPEVISTTPAAGATGVSVDVSPVVTFSEPVQNVTQGTLQLRDASGSPVPQSGDPQTSDGGTTWTIDPADPLEPSSDYYVWADGGSGGITDTSDQPMESDFAQDPPFTTEAGDGDAPTVSGTNPADGATGVALTVEPTVTFSEPMDPASITTGTLQLRDPSGQPVAQAADPVTTDGGTTWRISPAEDLAENTTYTIWVDGGSGGVTDEAGNPMASDWEQTEGFTTENLPPGTVQNLRRTDVQ